MNTGDRLFFIGLIVFAIFCILFGIYNYPGESDAMKVCQLSHSHDVCFQTLNR